jgi:recombinational DNA repair ATPase RecF
MKHLYLRTLAHGAGPSHKELNELEISFLEDIYQLMQAAHFRLLSEEEWATAQEEEFTVSIRWHAGHYAMSYNMQIQCEGAIMRKQHLEHGGL